MYSYLWGCLSSMFNQNSFTYCYPTKVSFKCLLFTFNKNNHYIHIESITTQSLEVILVCVRSWKIVEPSRCYSLSRTLKVGRSWSSLKWHDISTKPCENPLILSESA
jgi:hypothetical protein